MYYFAYGSNMSLSRLRARVSSAKPIGCHSLEGHDLRFHKASKDGSGKCDAYFTSNPSDVVYGGLFLIDPNEKPDLDKAEGLGYGYDEKEICVKAKDGSLIRAVTYIASNIDESLKPYSWYMNHVLIGAKETSLPDEYIRQKMHSVEVIEDTDRKRDEKQRALHN